jgi:hypothetical protein
MTGILHLAARYGPKFEVLEIGSSAGLNLLIDRYRIDMGGTVVGPAASPVIITPAWSGPPPAETPIEIVGIRGCDVHPMDATDPAIEARLAAYIWAEAPERLVRVRRAIAMMREKGVRLEQADAAGWIEARLAEPQAEGVVRVLMHSVVWQYLPEPTANRIKAAMKAAGERATAERPLGWVMMEPDRSLGHQIVRVRTWPGDGAPAIVATAHAHAAWVKGGNGDSVGDGIALPEGAKVEI